MSLVALLLGVGTSLAQSNTAGTNAASTNLVQQMIDSASGLFHTAESKLGVGALAPVPLFDGSDFEKFYPWIAGEGTYVDPKKVFSVQHGLLHISGEQRGYLATKQEYSNYRLVLEYRWGEAKWDFKKPRNSGVFVHATGLDGLWMKSVECQVAEGCTGDLVIHGGAKVTSGDTQKTKDWTTITRTEKGNVENGSGKWNTMEVLCEGDRIQIKVNGKVTTEVNGVTPNRGKILLQSNGSEVVFRKIELQPLNQQPAQNCPDDPKSGNKAAPASAPQNSTSARPSAPSPANGPVTTPVAAPAL